MTLFSRSGMKRSRCLQRNKPLAFGTLVALYLTLSCAQLPPNQSNLSGRRIQVMINFASPIEPNFRYYFLINNAGSQNAPGPIAVYSRSGSNGSYGNGFASGTGGQKGFTDFVEIDNRQPDGYDLHHVIGDPVTSNFSLPVRPVYSQPYTSSDITQPITQLRFDIDLAQLITNPDGTQLSDRNQAVTLSRSIRYLQVNIVATNIVPTDPTTDVPDKEVDAMGDTRTSDGQTSFLILDLGPNQTNFQTYSSDSPISFSTQEPSGDDMYPPGLPHNQALNLLSWQISFSNFGQ